MFDVMFAESFTAEYEEYMELLEEINEEDAEG